MAKNSPSPSSWICFLLFFEAAALFGSLVGFMLY
jgi:hypothetical protein